MLEEYMKHLQPDSVDFDDTTQALAIISSAADHANTTVKKGVTWTLLDGNDGDGCLW